jgi:NAD(P)-dependent dehydrogenase (short-subunit alcohol dehydrogenase family)
MNLNGKRALVTGGAVRIGRAIAEVLLAEHYSGRPERSGVRHNLN